MSETRCVVYQSTGSLDALPGWACRPYLTLLWVPAKEKRTSWSAQNGIVIHKLSGKVKKLIQLGWVLVVSEARPRSSPRLHSSVLEGAMQTQRLLFGRAHRRTKEADLCTVPSLRDAVRRTPTAHTVSQWHVSSVPLCLSVSLSLWDGQLLQLGVPRSHLFGVMVRQTLQVAAVLLLLVQLRVSHQ